MGDWMERPRVRRRPRPVKPRRVGVSTTADGWYSSAAIAIAKQGRLPWDHQEIRALTPPEFVPGIGYDHAGCPPGGPAE